MINDALLVLTFVTTLGCGVAAGVFFAFSSFVMPGLRRLPAAQGIAAMQSINITAITPAFMIELVGTAAACAALVIIALVNLGAAYAPWLLAGGLVYVLGAIALTRAFHIPRNNALAGLDPDAPDAADRWARYLREWTAGNHLRALTCTVATGLLIVGMLTGR